MTDMSFVSLVHGYPWVMTTFLLQIHCWYLDMVVVRRWWCHHLYLATLDKCGRPVVIDWWWMCWFFLKKKIIFGNWQLMVVGGWAVGVAGHWGRRWSPLGGTTKVGGGGGGGTVMVAGGMAWLFWFLIYFTKLNNRRLKFRFELNWWTYENFLLVEYGIEKEKWDRRFELLNYRPHQRELTHKSSMCMYAKITS